MRAAGYHAMSTVSVAIVTILLLLPHAIAHAGNAELDALRLADETPETIELARDWRAFIESGIGTSVRRDGKHTTAYRVSLDLRLDHSPSPRWRIFVADRIDAHWPATRSQQGGPEHQNRAVNVLKEAYVSWRARPETLLDTGRINVHNGVATGYNPTDYFRAGALRSITSIDPASLRENRQGSIMLRGQHLWRNGSLTVLHSPSLARESNPKGFHLDPGATNRHERTLIALSWITGAVLTPQWLVYHEARRATQFGLNLAALLSDTTVAQIEWSGGRAPSQWAQAVAPLIGAPRGATWRNRLAVGLTHTTPYKLTVTTEWHYNGAAPDDAAWTAMRDAPLPLYTRYRAWAATAQEPPTRRALFLHALWQDAPVPRLDLALMHNRDLTDGSHRTWLEARYHLNRVEYVLQWQRNSGAALTSFGAAPELHGWQVALRYYY